MTAAPIYMDRVLELGRDWYRHEGENALILEALLRGFEIEGHEDKQCNGHWLDGRGTPSYWGQPEGEGCGRGSGYGAGDGEGPGREGSGNCWISEVSADNGAGDGRGNGRGPEWWVYDLINGWVLVESLDGQ